MLTVSGGMRSRLDDGPAPAAGSAIIDTAARRAGAATLPDANDAAELLVERLQDKIEIDFPTARRLFTLICVLHIKG